MTLPKGYFRIGDRLPLCRAGLHETCFWRDCPVCRCGPLRARQEAREHGYRSLAAKAREEAFRAAREDAR